jgi:hypothetical protein
MRNIATCIGVVLQIQRVAPSRRQMRLEEGRMSMRQEWMWGVALLVGGLAIAGISVTQMGSNGAIQAQVTPQTSPPAAGPSADKPAESKPGGTRPTTPAPEPARPQNNLQENEGGTTGQSPPRSGDRPPTTGTPLPPAPAEKVAPPVQPAEKGAPVEKK